MLQKSRIAKVLLFVLSALIVAACGGGGGGGSSTDSTDVEPNAFDLGDSATVSTPEAYVESAAIAVTGINSAATISITNGQFRIVGVNEYTDTPVTTIEPGQEFQVRVQASLQVDQTETATLTIGAQSDTFSVLTEDTTAPTASVVFPTPNTLSDGNTLTLRGTSTDDFGPVTSVQVTVTPTGGSPVVFEQTVTEGDLRYTWSVLVNLNTDTVNTISVVAVDDAGNTQDTPTVVTVTQTTTPNDFLFPEGNSDAIFLGSTFKGLAWDRENGNLLMPVTGPARVLSVNINTGVRSVLVDNDPEFSSFALIHILEDQAKILFGDQNAAVLYMADLDGDNLSVLSNSSTADSDTPIVGVYGMARHSSGTLYVADLAGSLYTVNVNPDVGTLGARNLISDSSRPATGENPFANPSSLILDEAENRALVTDYTGGQLLWVDLASGARSLYVDNDVLVQPFDIVFDADDNRAFVVDHSLEAILSINLDDEIATIDTVSIISSDAIPVGGSNDLHEPWGLVIDGENDIGFVISDLGDFGALSAIRVVDLNSGERVTLTNSVPQ